MESSESDNDTSFFDTDNQRRDYEEMIKTAREIFYPKKEYLSYNYEQKLNENG